jgi:hypothetical protein
LFKRYVIVQANYISPLVTLRDREEELSGPVDRKDVVTCDRPLHMDHRDERFDGVGLGFGIAEVAVQADDRRAGGQDVEDEAGHAVPGAWW